MLGVFLTRALCPMQKNPNQAELKDIQVWWDSCALGWPYTGTLEVETQDTCEEGSRLPWSIQQAPTPDTVRVCSQTSNQTREKNCLGAREITQPRMGEGLREMTQQWRVLAIHSWDVELRCQHSFSKPRMLDTMPVTPTLRKEEVTGLELEEWGGGREEMETVKKKNPANSRFRGTLPQKK